MDFVNNCLNWLKGHRGERKYLPLSEGRGQALAQEKLFPLQAQIAFFFGTPAGTLKDLQEGVMKLSRGEQIVCSSCGRDIWKEKHRSDCRIFLAFQEVITTQPSPPQLPPQRKK